MLFGVVVECGLLRLIVWLIDRKLLVLVNVLSVWLV